MSNQDDDNFDKEREHLLEITLMSYDKNSLEEKDIVKKRFDRIMEMCNKRS